MKMTVAVKDDSQFHLLFTSLPLDEKLIEEYTCSYNEGAAVSIGKLYISQQHVSYASKIGSTHIILPIKEISSISKKNSVYLFPNAIEIVNFKDHKYFFSAFLSRDLAFATLSTIINAGGGTRTKIFEDALLAEQQLIADNNKIKNSSDEIEHPLSSSNGDNLSNDPFQETPTYSTFRDSNNNNNASNIENTNNIGAINIEENDRNSNSSDSSRFLKSSPSPSPSNKMLGSRIERKDSFESSSSAINGDQQLNNSSSSSGTFNTANLEFSKRNSNSQQEILSNHRNSCEIPPDTLVGEDDNNNINTSSSSTSTNTATTTTSSSSSNNNNSNNNNNNNNNNNTNDNESTSSPPFEPILSKQDSLSNLNINKTDKNNNNNNNNIQSPLKSSQTINPTPPSPVQRRTGVHNNHNNNTHNHSNHSHSNNNSIKDRSSPPNVSPTNITKENHEKPSQTTQLQQTDISSTSTTASTASSSTPATNTQTAPPSTTAATPVIENFSAGSPKLSAVSSFERLPIADKCDHIAIAEFDEAPWSTEKYQISISEFYELICRTDFWGSVNTTHSYTEQNLSEWKQTNNCCIRRDIDFRTAISFKIGPKSTRVFQTQRCKLKNKGEFIMQSTSISKDVPYGDAFSVENLLVVQAIDSTSCITKLSSKIKFTKSVWGLSSMIQKTALQGNKEFFILWNTMVRNQIETYVYNKMKELKKQPAAVAAMIQQQQPITTSTKPPMVTSASTGSLPIHQQHQKAHPTVLSSAATVTNTTTSVSTAPVTVQPNQQPVLQQTQQSVQQISTTSQQPMVQQSVFAVEEGETLSSTIWKKMSVIEKGVLAGIFILFLTLLLGLTIGIVSNSSTSRSLNNQLYRFSDSLILLDSRINSLATQTPVDDGKVTYTSNIGKDRITSLKDRLDLANSLLLRAQSMISTLNAELSIEQMKSERIDNNNYNYSDNGNNSGSGLYTSLFLTIIIATVSIVYFKFYK